MPSTTQTQTCGHCEGTGQCTRSTQHSGKPTSCYACLTNAGVLVGHAGLTVLCGPCEGKGWFELTCPVVEVGLGVDEPDALSTPESEE